MDLIDGEKRYNAVEISYSVDAELRSATPDGKYSLGGSVAIYFIKEGWKLVGDVGWSCRDVGWEPYYSRELEGVSLTALQAALPAFVKDILSRYVSFVDSQLGNVEKA